MTEALKTAILASVIWLLLCIAMNFILPPMGRYAATVICSSSFILLPTVNHLRMLLAIRRHNRQMGDAVAAQQMSSILRREKKVAIDMCVIALILLGSLVPFFCMEPIRRHYPRIHAIAFPWCVTVALMTSTINPSFNLIRNPTIRNAVKSMMKI